MSNKNKLKKYFGEIMREYFAVGTPKYYKINISNTKTLLNELNSYIKITNGTDYLNINHVKCLIEEYLYYSEKDVVYKKYHVIFSSFDLFLKGFLEKGKKDSSDKEFKSFIFELKTRIQSIIRTIEKNYFSKCETILLSVLDKDEDKIQPSDFLKIKKVVHSYSTEILNQGYSIYYAYENISKYLNGGFASNKDFISIFKGEKNEYEIYKKIYVKNGDIIKILEDSFGKENIFKSFPIEKSRINISRDSSKFLEPFLSCNETYPNCVWIKSKEIALDYISASNNSVNKIQKLLDLVKFEFINEQISIHHHGLLIDSEGTGLITYIGNNIYVHRMNSSKTFFDYKKDKIDKIMDSDVIEQSTKEKINTIFRFYRFFIESNTIEHKFLNLWIGWEHIFSLNFGKGSTTWSNIQHCYPIIESVGYIDGIVRDLLQVQINIKANPRIKSFVGTDIKHSATNLYRIIKEDGDDWRRMINTPCLRDNDLLLVKLFRLQQKFKFPKDFIKNNRKKTEWNLYRLYRVRNSIVHKGNIESLGLPIEKLTLDLEEYYTNLLEIILDRFSENDRFENIEQLFISFEKTYDFIQSEKGLSSTLDESEVKNKILNPILLF